MHFRDLSLSKWQQFQEISIDLTQRLTILTGANGSGKTTLLNLLARHSGWNFTSLATPREDHLSRMVKYFSRLFNGEDRSSDKRIGTLSYSNGSASEIHVPETTTAAYAINVVSQQNVPCIFIPSHRATFRYQAVPNIPTGKKTTELAYNEVANSAREQYKMGGRGGPSASFIMKTNLISWVINGYGVRKDDKVVMRADSEQMRNFEGFEDALRKILPPTLGFKELTVRNMEIVFVCNEGRDEFLLETASGGVSTLIELAWQIYMFSTNHVDEFTVIVDEMENHLHPSLQRRVLGDLLTAFPAAGFIVSTHSPLIVSSVRDASLFVLRYPRITRYDLKH